MSKYHSDDEVIGKRVDKNKNNYQDILDVDVDKINLSNNVSVISTPNGQLDIEELQGILKKKYVAPRKSFQEYDEQEPTDLEITKEYKLKDAIDKAYSEKDDDYEKNRYKKLRDTEYEILKSLNVDDNTSQAKNNSPSSEEGEMITSLLKTIDENALKRSAKSDELLSDLMSDGTDVLEPIKPDTDELEITPPKPMLAEELERTKQLSKKEIMEELEKEEKTNQVNTLEETVTNTFYTGNLAIDDADMEDFKDIENEINSNGVLVKILIILLVLVVLVVAVYLLNKYLNLGLF